MSVRVDRAGASVSAAQVPRLGRGRGILSASTLSAGSSLQSITPSASSGWADSARAHSAPPPSVAQSLGGAFAAAGLAGAKACLYAAGLYANRAQMNLPPPTTVAVVQGNKAKMAVSEYAHLKLEPGIRYARLDAPAGHISGVMASTLAAGGYGKVRPFFADTPVLAADGKPLRLVVKELLLARKPPPSPDAPAKEHQTYMHVSPGANVAERLHNVLLEAQMTQELRAVIDHARARAGRPAGDDATSAGATHASAEPFQILDVVHAPDRDKAYVIMTAMVGDLRGLYNNLPTRLRSDLAVSTTDQGLPQLAWLHAWGVAHLDLKQDNLLVGPTAQIDVIDFGLIRAIDRSGESQQEGPHGTLLSPEMLPINPNISSRPGRLGAGTDIWAFAATVVLLAGDPGADNPFVWPRLANPKLPEDPAQRQQALAAHGARVTQAALDRMNDFDDWRASIRRPEDGVFDVTRIGPKGLFGRFFAPLAASRPALCALLLEHAFARDPKARLPAALLHAKFRSLSAETLKVDIAGLVQSIHFMDRTANHEALQSDAEVYREFAAHAAQNPSDS